MMAGVFEFTNQENQVNRRSFLQRAGAAMMLGAAMSLGMFSRARVIGRVYAGKTTSITTIKPTVVQHEVWETMQTRQVLTIEHLESGETVKTSVHTWSEDGEKITPPLPDDFEWPKKRSLKDYAHELEPHIDF